MSRFDSQIFTTPTPSATADEAQACVNRWSAAVDGLSRSITLAIVGKMPARVVESLDADLSYACAMLREHRAELIAICGG